MGVNKPLTRLCFFVPTGKCFYLMAVLLMESNGVKKPYRSRVVFVGKKMEGKDM